MTLEQDITSIKSTSGMSSFKSAGSSNYGSTMINLAEQIDSSSKKEPAEEPKQTVITGEARDTDSKKKATIDSLLKRKD